MAKLKHVGEQSVCFAEPPYILGWGSVAGKKESDGPLGSYLDQIVSDPMCGKSSWEEAEGELQKKAVETALTRAKLIPRDIQYLVAGDLQAQITGSTFGVMDFQIPLLGVYGACSTMGESLSVASMLVEGGFAERVVAVTSSHTEVAERQFRFPLPYGNQKPLSATWTVTGSGAFVLGREKNKQHPCVRITGVTTGKIIDYGVKDSMNMGACMAPAAANVIATHLKDFGRRPEDYDKIITGDLGMVGQRILLELLLQYGYDIEDQHMDCGIEIYHNREQDTHAGGSGCGCSAITLAGYGMNQFINKKWNRVLFVPTGALLSKVSFTEGQTIPGIAHGVVLERED